MNKKGARVYSAISADIQCEVKDHDAPFGYSDDMHNHDCHEVIILLAGEIHLYTEYSGIKMKRGDVCFIPNYAFHSAYLYTPEVYDRIVINVKDEMLNTPSSKMDLKACFAGTDKKIIPHIHLNDDELEDIKEYALKLQENLSHSNPGADILADAYLKLIMVKLATGYSDDPVIHCTNILPEVVRKTFKYIDEHLTEELTLATLEKEIHHNGTYISRSIKKISGLSLQQYIIAKRIALSCKYIREGISPGDACFMSGFNNYSNFSRTFTKKVGISPKQLQMNYRKGNALSFGIK